MENLCGPRVASSPASDLVPPKVLSFISMEDETGIANVIITPDVYERNRLLVTRSKFLMVEGLLQSQDGVVHVKAAKLVTLSVNVLKIDSHDFH
jgi:error-prone DNA polymerase